MSKIAWAVIIGLVALMILILGATLLFPFWARGIGLGLARAGWIGGFGLARPFLWFRGVGAFLFWLLLFAGIILIIRALAEGPSSTSGPGSVTTESPLDILKRRYAKGEINKEQYDEIRSNLSG
jgi:putative membrane protein